MKKVLSLVMALGLFVGFSSCGDDGPGGARNCEDAVTNWVNAYTAYGEGGAPTEGECEDVKAALIDLIDECNWGNYVDEEVRAEIEALDCGSL